MQADWIITKSYEEHGKPTPGDTVDIYSFHLFSDLLQRLHQLKAKCVVFICAMTICKLTYRILNNLLMAGINYCKYFKNIMNKI